METRSRTLEVPGIHNFRDLGGYAGTNGRLKWGRLYRSGQPTHASDEALNTLSRLGLATVVDLRGGTERLAAPNRLPTNFTGAVYFSDAETVHSNMAPHAEAVLDAMDGASARKRMTAGYETMQFRPSLVEMYTRYLHSLAQSPDAAWLFCTSGKDRTGLAVALLHAAVGVHTDDIFADYLLTNTAGDVEARIDAIRRDLDQRFNARLSEDAVRIVTLVEPQYLERAFSVIRERHGSLDSYLEHVLQLTPPRRAAIIENFVT